jgi:IS30 family transposase
LKKSGVSVLALVTITGNNGKEFAHHKAISESLGIKFYFPIPYHSWERGSNENLNGLIRRYIPKKTDFGTLSDRTSNKLNTI